MTVSVLLRLVSQALAAGRIAGEAEVVETGERALVRDADELLSFLERSRPAGGDAAQVLESDGRPE